MSHVRIHSILSLLFLMTGCVSYRVSDDRVDYVEWNEGSGKVVTQILSADPDTFQGINRWFAIDKNQAYFKSLVIDGADPSSFEVGEHFFSKDQNHAYYRYIRIDSSDGSSFEQLGNSFAKDDKNYFYQEYLIPVCDYESFTIIAEDLPSRAIDNECYYYKETKVDISDRSSLEVLPGLYVRTKDAVYWGRHRIEEAQPKTFEVMTKNRFWVGRDKNFCFSGPRKIECSAIVGDTYEFCRCGQKD